MTYTSKNNIFDKKVNTTMLLLSLMDWSPLEHYIRGGIVSVTIPALNQVHGLKAQEHHAGRINADLVTVENAAYHFSVNRLINIGVPLYTKSLLLLLRMEPIVSV